MDIVFENGRIPTLYIMCGVSGSGKSERAKQIRKKTRAKIVSTEDIVKQYKFNTNDIKQKRKLYEIAYDRVRTELLKGNDVVFDDICVTVKSIKKLRKGVKYKLWMTANIELIEMDTTLPDCVERSKMGRGMVEYQWKQLENARGHIRALVNKEKWEGEE